MPTWLERSDDIVHVIRRLQEELTGERRKIQEKVRNALIGSDFGDE